MGNTIISFLGGALGAALVGGIFSLITHRLSRKDKLADKAADQKEDAEAKADVQNKALRYIMLYIIQERAKSHIKDGKITLEEVLMDGINYLPKQKINTENKYPKYIKY